MSQFPIFQTDVPRIGRDQTFAQLVRELEKPNPAHISLVGPRYAGKSVLLHSLVKHFRRPESPFQGVMYWDLGHRTPQTDAEFLAMLRRLIAETIKGNHPDESFYLNAVGAGYDELHEVIEVLGNANEKLLVFWDGFDRPLREGSLTRNLWDNLLELCRMSGFCVVTASRRRLSELIRDANSVASDFWGVFDSIRLSMMDCNDLDAFAGALPSLNFEPGALKEVLNWTAGLPPLVAWLMNQVEALPPTEKVNQQQINRLASNRDERCAGILEEIWNDCPAPAKDLYRTLCESGPQKTVDIPKADRLELTELGIATVNTGSIAATCRMLGDHIAGESADFGALARLFGTWHEYTCNIRGIMERRLSHLERVDETLFHMVERAIEEIPDHPSLCLAALSQIEDRAFGLIWKWECDDEGALPPLVISHWSSMPKSQRHRLIDEMICADESGSPNAWRIPQDRAKQLALLQFLTGSDRNYDRPLGRYAQKDTYYLLHAIHGFRNRTEHDAGQPIHIGVAVSAIMLCVELLGCLAREIPTK